MIRRLDAAQIPSLSEQKLNLRPCLYTAAFGMISATQQRNGTPSHS
jgi:hypothetical protein